MNGFDIAILVVGIALILIGFVKGVLRIAIGIVSLAGAFLLASWFDTTAGELFSPLLASSAARRLAGFALIFLVVLLAGTLTGRLICKTLEKVHLRWIDRLAGALAGCIAAALLFGALLIPLACDLPSGSSLLTGSRLAPYVVRIAGIVKSVVPADASARFHEEIQKLQKEWEKRQS